MKSFIEFFLDEAKYYIDGEQKYGLPTNIKKSKSPTITSTELKKATEVLECIQSYISKVIKGDYSRFEFNKKSKNKNTLANLGYKLADQDQWSKIANDFITKIKPSDFSFDYKDNDRNTWVYEFIIHNFKTDSRFDFSNVSDESLNRVDRHLYFKFTFKYVIKDYIKISGRNEGYPTERSGDNLIYINPKNVYMMTVSIHGVSDDKKSN